MASLTSGIPQSTANPLEAEFNRPWLEVEAENAAKMDAWRRTSLDSIDRAALDPDDFFKDKPVKVSAAAVEMLGGKKAIQRDQIVASYLTLANNGRPIPSDPMAQEAFRDQIAFRDFDGQGIGSPDAFYGEIVRKAQGRKDRKELYATLSATASTQALLATSDVAATGFQTFLAEARKHPGYQPGRDFELLEAWGEQQGHTRELLEEFGDALPKAWKVIAGRGNGDDSQAVLDAWREMNGAARGRFLDTLGRLGKSLSPDERRGFWQNFAIQASRDISRTATALGRASQALPGSESEITWHASRAEAESAGKEKAQSAEEFDKWRADLRSLEAGLARVLSESYDPIRGNWGKEGSTLRAIESGIYSIPGVGAIVATSLIPGGQVATAAMLEDEAWNNINSTLLEAGLDPTAASARADELSGVVAAVNYLPERFGLNVLARRVPGLSMLTDKVRSRVGRGLLHAATAQGVEFTTETFQNYSHAAILDALAYADSELPGGNLARETENWWTDSVSTFTAVLPMALLGVPGSMSRESHAAAVAETDARVRAAWGFTAEDNAAIDAAEGPGALVEAVERAQSNRDPKSEEAKDATQELAEEIQAEREAAQALTEEAQLSGVMPTFLRTPDGWQVNDGETGAEIGTSTTADGALRLAQAHSGVIDATNADEIAALGTLLEAGDVVASSNRDGSQTTTEFRPGEVVTASQQAALSDSDFDRVAAQTTARERINGGDGTMAQLVLGQSSTELRQRVRNTVNRINAGGSVLTVFHEETHGFYREALETGRLQREEIIATLRAIETVLAGKSTRDGQLLRFLPEQDAEILDVHLDEAVAELIEAEILRTRKGSRSPNARNLPPGLVTRNLTALARLVPGATAKFRNFIESVRAFWGLTFHRAVAIKQAIRNGDLDEAKLDDFKAKLFGLSQQDDFEQQARDAEAALLDGAEMVPAVAEGDPFSIGRGPVMVRPLDSQATSGDPATDEQTRDPSAILAAVTGQGDSRSGLRADGRQRRKHGREIASHADLLAWAQAAGRILDPAAIDTSGWEDSPGGGEHKVLFDEESGRVVKLTKPALYGAQGEDAGAYLERWALHNRAFDDDVAFEGFVTLPGESDPRAVISQSFAVGRDATPEEQADYLTGRGFHEVEPAKWIHPVRGVTAWDTITPGNAIMTADGVRVIDYQVAPADPAELNALRQRTGIGRPTSFSLGSARLGVLTGDSIRRIKDPVRRAQAMERVSRKLEDLRLEAERLELLAGSKRLKRSLAKEAAMRQAIRQSELENEAWARHHAILSDDDLTKLKSQPGHAFLADPSSNLHGRLMSKSAAIKAHPDLFQLHSAAEYDGSENVSRSLFGGTLRPDLAAQEMFEAGLIREPSTDAMWQLLEGEARHVASMRKFLDVAKADLRESRTVAKAETNEWLKQQTTAQEANYSPRQEILRTLAALDAILSSVPPEIRGKVGGYVQAARITSPDAGLEFLRERLAKVDEAMEEWLLRQYDIEFRALLERARPERDETGKKPSGKIGSEIHQLFDSVRAAMTLSADETEAEAVRLESLAQGQDTTATQASHLTLEANLVRLTGNWSKADAARREAALLEATRIYEGGYLQHRIEMSRKRERRAFARDRLQQATGKSGTRSELQDRQQQDQGSKTGRARSIADNFRSFEQVIQQAFGLESEDARMLVDWERRADAAKTDAIHHKQDLIEQLFTDLAGSRYKGEQLHERLSRKGTIVINGESFSELEAITATLMWRQQDGRRHMTGHLDDQGAPTGDWHYDDAFMGELEDKLSEEAKAIRLHIGEQYAAEYDRLNAVFSQLYGVNLPRHKAYSPLTVAPANVPAGQVQDPMSEFGMSAVSLTPGSLRKRSETAVAKPLFRDALEVYLAHSKQMEHWMAYAPFATEAMGILNTRELSDSIEAAAGREAVSTLRSWLDYFAQGGNRDATAHIAFNKLWNRIASRFASMALVGRVSVLAIQSTQLGAAWSQMPTGAYLSRFARLLTGQLGWSAALKSEYIQRRLKQQPAIVQQAMEGLRAGKPSRLKFFVRSLGRTIAGADALFTAGTFAIVHDYQLARAKTRGLSGPEAETWALNEAERATDRVAQPVRPGARSLVEITGTNPAMRILWSFASDARQKLALSVLGHADRTVPEKMRALAVTWLVGGVVATVLRSTIRDLRDDGEDDEIFDERNWDLGRMSLSAALGPLQGIALIGDVIEATMFAAMDEYLPSGTMLETGSNAAKGARHVPDWFTGDREVEDAMKDAEAMLTGAGMIWEGAAAGTNLMHIARDLFAIADNLAAD